MFTILMGIRRLVDDLRLGIGLEEVWVTYFSISTGRFFKRVSIFNLLLTFPEVLAFLVMWTAF